MSTSTPSQVTPEEKDFIFSQWPDDQIDTQQDAPGACEEPSILAGAA